MITFDRVCAGYGGAMVLQDICATLQPGRITVLIGKNGCGKSTLLRVACGLLPPKSGRVLLGDASLTALPPRELAKQVAFLPQSRPVPEMSVEDLVGHGRFPYLSFPRRLTPTDSQLVQRAMERMGVLEFRDKPLGSLSGGERQKAYLAMVLAQDAPLILLDEPTTYLDIGHQFEILALLSRLREEKKTVVAVLHDLAQALSVADDLCLMDAGRIAIHSSAQEVLASGEIDRVFGVSTQVATTPDGRAYHIFEPRG